VTPEVRVLGRSPGGIVRAILNHFTPLDALRSTGRFAEAGAPHRHDIDWRTSARIGRLAVREVVPTADPGMRLVLDTDATRYADRAEFDLAVSVLCSLAIRAIRDRSRVEVRADGRLLPSGVVTVLLDAAGRLAPGPVVPGDESRLLRGEPRSEAGVLLWISGSRLDPPTMRRVVRGFLDEAVLVVQIAPAQRPGMRSASGLNLSRLARLEDLPRLLQAPRESR
jgi:hypothetical protein